MSVEAFPHRPGTLLCNVALIRRPDGTIATLLGEMPSRLIETTGEDVASRVEIIAGWMKEGAADMARQAEHWAEALGK
ncbi:hypothetical protein [Sphingobium bisphenolivorans]|uniref:hypothetical protein n=1 Tax=Sphingobium bisphenolivorans TaxID=1335760 RepID=UPI00039CBDA1|nr:hypothetical protein [Sphingobium bisphenolivorans]